MRPPPLAQDCGPSLQNPRLPEPSPLHIGKCNCGCQKIKRVEERDPEDKAFKVLSRQEEDLRGGGTMGEVRRGTKSKISEFDKLIMR